MAKIKQLTLTISNRPGALAEIARTLANAKVNILGLLGTAQGASGTVELIVDDARRAKKALDDAHCSYRETAAEQCEVANRPGTLADCLGKLAARGVNLNSITATSTKNGKKAVIIYTVAAAAAATADAA